MLVLLSIPFHTSSCRSTWDGEESRLLKIDGSSTVYPLTEAVVDRYREVGPNLHIAIGISGTGGGFEKFSRGETSISDASRPIQAEELAHLRRNGFEVIELPVAYDGIVVAVHPENEWCSSLTVEDLARLWEPQAQGRILYWNQIRTGWPDERISLYGPGVQSGTYDYFTKAIVGEEGVSRGDFTASEDDNVLVRGVAGNPYALGFFGYSYFQANVPNLKRVAIDDEVESNGAGPVLPTPESIRQGHYQPLSRPVFIYVRRDRAEDPQVARFVEFYIRQVPLVAGEVGYVPLRPDTYEAVRRRFRRRITGSAAGAGGAAVGLTVEEILQLERE